MGCDDNVQILQILSAPDLMGSSTSKSMESKSRQKGLQFRLAERPVDELLNQPLRGRHIEMVLYIVALSSLTSFLVDSPSPE